MGGSAVHVGAGTGEQRWHQLIFCHVYSLCPNLWCVFQCVVFAGQLNAVASLVTVFYLLAYAAVDLACLALEWASAPNFR